MSFDFHEHFQKEKINVYWADCMNLMRSRPDGYYDIGIIDPPYGIDVVADMNRDNGKVKGSSLWERGTYELKDWDKTPPPPEYFTELRRVSKHQIIWGANHFISRIPFDSSCWIVWDKDTGENGYADCELAWTSFDWAVRKVKLRWSGFLQHDMKNREERIHPTQKPVALYSWILDKFANPDYKILDTHGGSLSHAIAAYYYGCELDICEIDEQHYRDGIKRFQEQTIQHKLF